MMPWEEDFMTTEKVLFKGQNVVLLMKGGYEHDIRNGKTLSKSKITNDGRVILSDGPDGLAYKSKPGVLGLDGCMLMFYCKHCKTTSSTKSLTVHLPDCKHPHAGCK